MGVYAVCFLGSGVGGRDGLESTHGLSQLPLLTLTQWASVFYPQNILKEF